MDTEEEIEEFLNAFGISPTETNSLINVENVRAETQEQIAIQEFIANLEVDFPTSEEMSATARYIQVHIPQELRIRSRGTERHSASN